MNRLYHIVVYTLFLWVMLGSAGLIYFQYIDGSLINRPITFYVDIHHMKTDKKEYHRGDTVYVLTSFCRNRPFTAISQWKLVNETVIFFPEGRFTLAKECLKDKYVAIGEIPPYAIGGTHHLEGATAAKLNPLRTIYFDYRSNDFEVVI